MSPQGVLLLSAFLLAAGLYGVLTRSNIIGILLGVELMFNAGNLNLVTFARLHGDTAGQLFALVAIAVTVAEVAVGLALVILLYQRRRTAEPDQATLLRG
jgi:NADH-quinone oxidoreductase subunit K